MLVACTFLNVLGETLLLLAILLFEKIRWMIASLLRLWGLRNNSREKRRERPINKIIITITETFFAKRKESKFVFTTILHTTGRPDANCEKWIGSETRLPKIIFEKIFQNKFFKNEFCHSLKCVMLQNVHTSGLYPCHF